MSEQELQLLEEERVGEALAKTLTDAEATNETVCNVLFNLLLALIEDGDVRGSISSEKVTLTISRPEA